MTRNLSLLALAMLIALIAPARAQTLYDGTASSSVHVESTSSSDAGKAIVMSVRNARLVPYVIYVWRDQQQSDADALQARLATITTDVKTRTDAEGVDPSSTVSVTVDDVSGKEPRRLASFSEPGSEGVMLGHRYFSAIMPGCCDSPQIHRVHVLETGRALFRSTGPDPAGSAAWAEVPNARPEIVRWAAFDGEVQEADAKHGLLGHISYGDNDGPLSVLELRTRLRGEGYDNLWEGVAHGAKLIWIDPRASKDSGGPSSGDPDSPKDIWAAEGTKDPKQLGGFQLAVTLDGKRLATIPIAGDRLVPSRAIAGRDIYVPAPAQ
ncbi:MAG TPA: hypothetical protein VN823_07125 [Stellaceae bacterium]|nr:hypothetical protein [Stellaceae bacterium]